MRKTGAQEMFLRKTTSTAKPGAFPATPRTGRVKRTLAMLLMGTALGAIMPAIAPTPLQAATCTQAGISATAINAVKLARKGDLSRALQLAGQDAAVRKTAQWAWLRHNMRQASAEQLAGFAAANSRWPLASTFRAAAELKLLLNADDATLARHFGRHRPASAAGHAALARHLLATGKRNEARAALHRAWRNVALPDAAVSYIRKNAALRSLLTRADDEARLWRLIMAQQTLKAVRFARHMPRAHRQAAAAARALMRRQRGAIALYRKLPASMRGKQAVRYALARYYRRQQQPLKALAMLKNLPRDNARLIRADQWWTEKRLVARHLLQLKYRQHWRDAYRLAASHGFSSGKHAFRGEFLAGFIAFEKLGMPKTALKHFERLPKLAKSRTWKSQGWYWVGRARERLGDIAGARRAYEQAARTPTVYYGLLAREKLGLGRKPIPLKTATATTAAKCRVAAHELGRAVRLLKAAGESKATMRMFVWPLAYSFNKPQELAAAAALLWDLSGPANAVRLAKAAGARGIDIDNYAYPVKALPPHRSKEKVLELPVVLSLVRQESEFDHSAYSRVGARGLMQLMPATARIEARHVGVRYHPNWLHTRPAYNLLLGRHHLARIMEHFSGSYAMAFAAYNAGGGNVRKWLKNYGDMRTGTPDPVEWVELIPFTETRTYVKKLLQGLHVYRTRLGRPMQPMSKDLWRGVPGWRELVLRGGSGNDRRSGSTGSYSKQASASRADNSDSGTRAMSVPIPPQRPDRTAEASSKPRDIADLIRKY